MGARAKTRRTTWPFEPDGSVLVATGNKGKIYRLAGDPLQPTLVTRANAQQVTALLRDQRRARRLLDVEPGQGVPAVADARRSRHLHVRRARRADGCDVGRDPLAGGCAARDTRRDLDAIRQHAHAGRNLERLDAARTHARKAVRSPARARAICSGARCSPASRGRCAAADVGDRRVSAAQHAPATSPSITIHPPGTVFQRPFPTGDPEIAGFDGDTPDRRATAQEQGHTGGIPELGRRGYQKGC